MKGFQRKDLSFSLCGLNCGLCPMRLGGHCPGCGGGAGNQGCAIARCSQEHGSIAYCWQCAAYPCPRHEAMGEYDTIITTQRRREDMARMQAIGPEAYGAEQAEKAALLHALLERHNDGRRKGLFCLAVNLLPLQDVRDILRQLDAALDLPVKERAGQAAAMMQQAAEERQVILRLRKKQK